MITDYDTFWKDYQTGKRGYSGFKNKKIIFDKVKGFPNSDLFLFKIFAELIDWNKLGKKYPHWSEFLIDKLCDDKYFIQDNCFGGLSQNTNFKWTYDLVNKYRDKIGWRSLAINEGFEPDLIFLTRYKEYWDWEYWITYKSERHNSIQWNTENIVGLEKYVLPWIKERKNVDWNIEFILKYKEDLFHIDESSYSKKYNILANRNIIWSSDLIENTSELIDWHHYQLMLNETFPFTIDIIERHKEKINFHYLSQNTGSFWTFELLETFKGDWDVYHLAKNPSIQWDVNLINLFSDEFLNSYNEDTNWNALCSTAQTWDISFIQEYKDRIDWDELCMNSSVLWTIELVSTFSSYLNIGNLSLFGNLSFDVINYLSSDLDEVRHKYQTIWLKFSDFGSEPNNEITTGWDNLSMNQNIIWTDDNILNFLDRINWFYLARYGRFSFSEKMLRRIPKVAIKFDPEYSMHYKRGNYVEVEILSMLVDRNIIFPKERNKYI